HRVAAEAELSDRGAVGSSEVMRPRGIRDADVLAYLAHNAVEPGHRGAFLGREHEADRRFAVDQFVDDATRRRRQPDAVILAVLRSGPTDVGDRRSRHHPPAIDDVLTPHATDLASSLTEKQNQL